MFLLKKWLAAGLALSLTFSLSSCSKPPADQAFKQSSEKLWTESYNYDGKITIEIKPDETAILGTKGGLSAEAAQKEQQFIAELQLPEAQASLAAMQNAKPAFHGAVDVKNFKYELIADLSMDIDEDKKFTFSIPLLIDLKAGPAAYVDPKGAGGFIRLPPEHQGKLLKLSLEDLSTLTAEQKAKFQPDGAFLKKFKEIITSSINSLDAAWFKDVDVTEPAKKAGAERTIQLTLTPEQSDKISQQMIGQLIDEFVKEMALDPKRAAELKKHVLDSNKDLKPYMGNTVTEYSLDGQGRLVYVTSVQSYRGAKHNAKITTSVALTDYGKPTFSIDPEKQGSVSFKTLQEQARQQSPYGQPPIAPVPGADASAPAQ